MCWHVIHDHEITPTERWCEALLDVRQENGAVHRSIDYEWDDGPVVAQACDKGDRCPCGTGATTRSPRAQRPRTCTMFVLIAVSSINTSRAGSSLPNSSRIQRESDVGSLLLCRVQAFF